MCGLVGMVNSSGEENPKSPWSTYVDRHGDDIGDLKGTPDSMEWSGCDILTRVSMSSGQCGRQPDHPEIGNEIRINHSASANCRDSRRRLHP